MRRYVRHKTLWAESTYRKPPHVALFQIECCAEMLNYPAASMRRCMPPVNARQSVDGADVWVSGARSLFFFRHFNFSVFLCLRWFKDIMQCLWEHPIWRSAIETQSLQNSLQNWKTASPNERHQKPKTLNDRRKLQCNRYIKTPGSSGSVTGNLEFPSSVDLNEGGVCAWSGNTLPTSSFVLDG